MKEAWGDLTDDEISMLNGKRDQFYGVVQERYGIAKDEAEKRIESFEKNNRNAA